MICFTIMEKRKVKECLCLGRNILGVNGNTNVNGTAKILNHLDGGVHMPGGRVIVVCDEERSYGRQVGPCAGCKPVETTHYGLVLFAMA